MTSKELCTNVNRAGLPRSSAAAGYTANAPGSVYYNPHLACHTLYGYKQDHQSYYIQTVGGAGLRAQGIDDFSRGTDTRSMRKAKSVSDAAKQFRSDRGDE
jgi:hypothetical protein